MGKPTEMGIAIVAGAITAAFINIDKIQSFKGAGFEASMVLKKAVNDAYATIDSLKELANPLIVSALESITYASRLGGIHVDKKHNLRDQLSKTAESMNIGEGEIKDAIKKFNRYHSWDHFMAVCNEIQMVADVPTEIKEELIGLRNYDSEEFPSKETVLKILGDHQLNENIVLVIDDYEYYLKHKKLRRKETLKMN